jgi:hypothetical protein
MGDMEMADEEGTNGEALPPVVGTWERRRKADGREDNVMFYHASGIFHDVASEEDPTLSGDQGREYATRIAAAGTDRAKSALGIEGDPDPDMMDRVLQGLGYLNEQRAKGLTGKFGNNPRLVVNQASRVAAATDDYFQTEVETLGQYGTDAEKAAIRKWFGKLVDDKKDLELLVNLERVPDSVVAGLAGRLYKGVSSTEAIQEVPGIDAYVRYTG